MRLIFLLCAVFGVQGSTNPVSELRMIEELNECMQARFQAPPRTEGPVLGMSRMVSPSSFGTHYVPRFDVTRDFRPENEREKKALASLEGEAVQAGFYLFGRAILDSDMEMQNYRALKGPAAITDGTPRPKSYPGMNAVIDFDALPDWKTVYPLALRAMKSFSDGGTGFETSIGSWRIAARPVMASQEKCVGCHNSPSYRTTAPAALNRPLGGVLYAYRRAGA